MLIMLMKAVQPAGEAEESQQLSRMPSVLQVKHLNEQMLQRNWAWCS